MKNTIFTRGIQILIVTLLILAVLKGKYTQQLMLGAILVWLMVTAGAFIIRRFQERGKNRRPILSTIRQRLSAFWEKCGNPEPAPEQETPERKEPPQEAMTEQELETMLHHISLRISDKIKSAYPQAVWRFTDPPSLRGLLAGKTVRIEVEDMEQYTHADISFDRIGRIHVEPMVIGVFGEATESPAGPDEPEGKTPPGPSVVDVQVWYDLIGQKALESLITELHANGYSKLIIKANGDVVINRQKKEVLQATLEAFPAKNYWEELISILEENELNGKIAGDSLQISWIS